MLLSGGFSRNYNNNVSTNMPNGIYIAKPKTRQLEEQEQKSTDLVQYALNKINDLLWTTFPLLILHNIVYKDW
jgi:predicted nucleotidyltransferase